MSTIADINRTNRTRRKSKTALTVFLFIAVVILLIICIRQSIQINRLTAEIERKLTTGQESSATKVFPTDMAAEDYPVRGVDVSSYQGNIDWQTLASQDISFAFIKATEGSSYKDSKFDANLDGALQTDLRVGAYHFFSYDSSGKTQAENFINAVPRNDNMLPPMIDVEFYGEYEDDRSKLPQAEVVQKELRTLVDMLYKRYGKKPVIYANEHSYELFIVDEFDDCDIWICSTTVNPLFLVDREWTFWQYNVTAVLEGYEGKHIDLNVFYGTKEQFEAYAR